MGDKKFKKFFNEILKFLKLVKTAIRLINTAENADKIQMTIIIVVPLLYLLKNYSAKAAVWLSIAYLTFMGARLIVSIPQELYRTVEGRFKEYFWEFKEYLKEMNTSKK
ncbi:hypothetical protein HNP89_001913 [Methanococcus maripaludis]|uniref:Uncharacterized protein n=1 Tax=Methanococcus maripaludis TaxID=39152 RepID=A0A7J9P3B2_METMI|nr:hypothetical protein [Methanococcus maripaludis]MBA2853935.1 hypothetical protein [Methanococcus maripaludis]